MSLKYICFNNKFYEESKPILALNRAMSFGDGVFETIRVKNGKALFLDLHFKRMQSGLNLLKIDLSSSQWQEINTCLDQLIIKNEIEEGAKVKLIVFRQGEGTYRPDSNKGAFYLKAEKIQHNNYILNKKGLKVGLVSSVIITPTFLSSYKTLNKIEYVLASIEAEEKGLDDLILLNNKDNIVEATSSNIFLVKGKKIFTPPLNDGCLSGVLRYQILLIAEKLRFEIQEISISKQNLLEADEVFLTNSVKGVQWVGSFSNKRYFSKVAQLFVSHLNI